MEPIALVVMISEIMYNPASSENLPNDAEWVEIYNPADAAVDISGWYLEDEDGKTAGLPEGTLLNAKTAAVFIPAEQNVADFQAAWGEGFAVYPVSGWDRTGLWSLANSPGIEKGQPNEVLTLRDAAGNVVDQVAFDDEGDWPRDTPQGPSIYVKPGRLNAAANDDGNQWLRSMHDQDGARGNTRTDDFDGEDIGSPGTVVE
jgi:hypothetical protein